MKNSKQLLKFSFDCYLKKKNRDHQIEIVEMSNVNNYLYFY